MQIHFERSGGFAGIRLTHSISSEALPAEEEQKLAELLEAARFFELPAMIRGQVEPALSADRIRSGLLGGESARQAATPTPGSRVPVLT